MPVSFATAALGGVGRGADARRSRLAEGPAGTEDGKLLRIKGRGAPQPEGLRQGRRARTGQDRGAEAVSKKTERELLEQLQKRDGSDESDRPRYMISVAAELVGMHPQTLRIYEQRGLVRPQRTAGNTRLYSDADIERLRLIQRSPPSSA